MIFTRNFLGFDFKVKYHSAENLQNGLADSYSFFQPVFRTPLPEVYELWTLLFHPLSSVPRSYRICRVLPGN